MRRALIAIVFAVVLAGCAAPVAMSEDSGTSDGELGVVDGVSYDDDLDISVDDGLNETELDLLAARSMARIEVIRGLEFEERADIEIWTREEYQEWRGEPNASQARTQWENKVWEAKFIVGQDRDVTAVFDETLGDAVGGFYSPSAELVVIVTDGETADVSKRTLVHELVHVLQDQQFGLDSPPARQDPGMARNGVVEGEAELIPDLYFERCESEWSCIEPPSSPGGGADIDPGIILVLLHPYQQGPVFVDAIQDRGGWDAVDQMYDNYPESTAQINDPDKYPDVSPVNVTVEDRSSEEWSPIANDPVRETIGQAAMFVMFYHNNVITVDDPFSYDHPVSDGWAGDELVPYATEDNETGHVWKTEWESEEDAEQFRDAYYDVLAEHGAMERGPRQFVISEGSYEGAYDVYIDGTTVTIVNGPTLDALPEIHALED